MMIFIYVQRATDQDAQSASTLETSRRVWGRAKPRNYNKVLLFQSKPGSLIPRCCSANINPKSSSSLSAYLPSVVCGLPR
jgi:hypothetical protein